MAKQKSYKVRLYGMVPVQGDVTVIAANEEDAIQVAFENFAKADWELMGSETPEGAELEAGAIEEVA